MQASLLQVERAVTVEPIRAEMVVQLLSLFKDNVGTARPGSSKDASATALQLHSSTVEVVAVEVLHRLQHAQVEAVEAVLVRYGLLLTK